MNQSNKSSILTTDQYYYQKDVNNLRPVKKQNHQVKQPSNQIKTFKTLLQNQQPKIRVHHAFPQQQSFTFNKNKNHKKIQKDLQPDKKIKIYRYKSQQNLLIQNPQPKEELKKISDTDKVSKKFSANQFIKWMTQKQNKQKLLNNIKPTPKQIKQLQTHKEDFIDLKWHAHFIKNRFYSNLYDSRITQHGGQLFGIIQSHGNYGPYIQQYLQQNLIKNIKKGFQIQLDFQKVIKKCTKNLFNQFINLHDEQLECSGATFSLCLIKDSTLYASNLGNNKIIVGYKNPHHYDQWEVKQISTSHQLSQQKEKARILKNGGKIYKSFNKVSKKVNFRVWGQKDTKVYGISSTRSFGDIFLSEYGVINIPDFSTVKLRREHKILFIGQQSIFQFMNEDEIMEICANCYQQNKSAQQTSKILQRQILELAPADQWSRQDFGFYLIFLN